MKWVGYTSDDDRYLYPYFPSPFTLYLTYEHLISWEPAENLDQCGPMLREFWENIDSLNPIGCTSTVGKVFSASEEWIGELAELTYSENLLSGRHTAQRKLLSNKPEAVSFF